MRSGGQRQQTGEPGPGEASWLAVAPEVERLDLGSGAWVDVVRGLVRDQQAVHDELAATVTWSQGRVFRYERWIPEPRLSGQPPRDRTHPALLEAQRWVERRYRIAFDGVALARYRDGRDSVAWHRDRELRWLEETRIGVLSLGARRPFLVRPLTDRRLEADDPTGVLDLSPAGGDLLVMGGRCQAAALHAVPKLPAHQRVPSRISAQWRWTSRRGRPDTNRSYYAPRHFGMGPGPRRPSGTSR
jgi:alkylated DNA repair dioxygenase AlkB